ncbi:AAA family ATPase [Candidatus Berkelbacteria bacterium]|nr:AAA family ATPase [Candidatus Berkelbacteria bacterium]
MKKIFGFVGRGGSGKGTACNYLQEKYGAGYHRFSAILQQLTDRIYLEPSRDHLIRMSEVIRREFGEDTLARVIMRDVENDSATIVTVDGIRRLADILYLKEVSGFVLVHIDAAPETRLARIQARGEKPDDATKTLEQFLADEQRSTEKSIDEVLAHPHVTVHNNGTREELFAQLDALIASKK